MNRILSTQKQYRKGNQFLKTLLSIPWIATLIQKREAKLIAFFCFLFLIIVIRLFWLQVIKHQEYDSILSKQHYRESLLTPERGNIYALDKGGHPVKLTENITLYDLAIDPRELQWKFETDAKRFPNIPAQLRGMPMKPRFIELISPVIYKHLCEINGMHEVSQEECVKNIELFAGISLLPKKPELFYFGSGMASSEYETFKFEEYEQNYQNIIQQFTKEKALSHITNKLDQKIKIWIKSQNYLGYFTEPKFLEEVRSKALPYLNIEADHYLYITPTLISSSSKDTAKKTVESLLKKWKYPIGQNFDKLFEQQEWKYIKLISGLNPALAQEVRELKITHLHELSEIDRSNEKKKLTRTPVLYGLVLEPFVTRYYPYGDFMANILGYVNRNGVAFYGIEEYFDTILKGKKWEIKGRTSAWLGNIGSNEFEIANPINGHDIYLTIDIWLQREVERIVKEQLDFLRADAISVLVTNAKNGEVKASVNAPSFDPNSYNDAYTLVPLGLEHQYIVDDLTYIDIPVYLYTWGDYRLATLSERVSPEEKKYLAKNIYGSQVFVDKNISVAFEPGSIFKAFTVAIGMDTDETSFEESYNDEGSVKVGAYNIKNASRICEGYNSFLHAFVHSCNVWMVRIVQRIWKYAFYNYLEKLGFGELTNIELAWEKEGFVDKVNIVSFARFLNNSFWQGLTTTQIQLAAAYIALVNGGEYLQPTIIEKIVDNEYPEKTSSKNQKKHTIFKSSSSNAIKEGLFNVINTNPELKNTANLSGFHLGAKSGTAQISFRGKYQRGEGRTNGTFAGIITTQDPKYVVNIWVRRPRRSQWWGFTAGPIFKQIAQYLLTYDM